MSLKTILEDITGRLRRGQFHNEQAVSQGVVLRVFEGMGWDIWNPSIVCPEFKTGEGRADFALCCPPLKPAILVEVKQPGKAEDAVRQALEYAFHAGVPFVVLTDGRTWSFYLPAEQGSYEDRRVYKLDLYERSSDEAAAALKLYLDRVLVESGEALERARREYRSRNRQEQARLAIPQAWRELVERGDDQLVEILAGVVESKAGVRPNVNHVAAFLASLAVVSPPKKNVVGMPTVGNSPSGSKGIPSTNPDPPIGGGDTTRAGKLTFRGKQIAYANAKEAMVLLLRQLATEDPQFLERVAQHPNSEGRKRRYVARSAADLYPDREDLRECCEELPGGWLVATNLNNKTKTSILEGAAEVAGLRWGKDMVVEF